MSSTTAITAHDTTSSKPAIPFTATIASEWAKLVSVRSTWITLALAAILSIGVTALVAWVTGWSWSEWTEADRASFDPIEFPLVGTMFAAILFVVLGVSLVAAEYNSGMMRLTMTVTPRQGRVLLAKVVVTAVTLIAGVAISIATFLTGQAVFAAYDLPTASLTDWDAFRAVVLGTALTAPVFPVLGVAMAFLFRSTAIAITSVLALIFAGVFRCAAPSAMAGGRTRLPARPRSGQRRDLAPCPEQPDVSGSDRWADRRRCLADHPRRRDPHRPQPAGCVGRCHCSTGGLVTLLAVCLRIGGADMMARHIESRRFWRREPYERHPHRGRHAAPGSLWSLASGTTGPRAW